MDRSRLITLSGITEDEDTSAADAAAMREQHAEKVIRRILETRNFVIRTVWYDDSTRTALAVLDNEIDGYPLSALAQLTGLGLLTDFRINNGDGYLELSFRVSPEVDTMKAIS